MPGKTKKTPKAQQWIELSRCLRDRIASVSSWYNETADFAELRLKARDDGTVLAIAKGFDAAGGPIVAFGSGYDVPAALLALDATLQGGYWKVDKPWVPPVIASED